MRVSIDESGPASRVPAAGSGGGKSADKKPGAKPTAVTAGGLDRKQKIKATGAIVIIVAAGTFMAWSNGLFQGRARPAPAPVVEPAEEPDQPDPGAAPARPDAAPRTLPPMPVGSS